MLTIVSTIQRSENRAKPSTLAFGRKRLTKCQSNRQNELQQINA